MIGALILGLLAGFIGKALVPGKDPGGFLATIVLGLAGAALGWLIFTLALGIGDTDAFDLGGLIGAVIGVVILLLGYRKFVADRAAPAPAAAPSADSAAGGGGHRGGGGGGRRRKRRH